MYVKFIQMYEEKLEAISLFVIIFIIATTKYVNFRIFQY